MSLICSRIIKYNLFIDLRNDTCLHTSGKLCARLNSAQCAVARDVFTRWHEWFAKLGNVTTKHTLEPLKLFTCIRLLIIDVGMRAEQPM